MFDDPGALDDVVRAIIATVAALVLANTLVLALATWGISRWARQRGRRGNRFTAFVVALGAEVFVIATLDVVLSANRVNSTSVGWLLGSVVVLGAATTRLCSAGPATEAS